MPISERSLFQAQAVIAKALLSPTTRMEDVFFGLYYWLERHPTETVLVSMNYEPGTGTPNDAFLQERIYRILTSDLAKEYWMQTSGKVRVVDSIILSHPPVRT